MQMRWNKLGRAQPKALHTCLDDTPIIDVARMMEECGCGAIPVVESEENQFPVGIVTGRDIATRLIARGRDPFRSVASDAMTKQLFTITEDDTIASCLTAMAEGMVRRLVVVDRKGKACGMVAQYDIAFFDPFLKVRDFLERIEPPWSAQRPVLRRVA